MIPERKYLMQYALNEQGKIDMDYCIQSENVISVFLPREEFLYFYNEITEKINQKFGLLIDEYEGETVPFEILNDLLEFLDSEKEMPVFYETVRKAIEYQSDLELEF